MAMTGKSASRRRGVEGLGTAQLAAPHTSTHTPTARNTSTPPHSPLLVCEHRDVHQPTLHCVHGGGLEQLQRLPHMRLAGGGLQGRPGRWVGYVGQG